MVPARATTLFVGVLVSLGLGCYSPNLGAVLYRCAPDSSCPSGLSCSDGFCVVNPLPACKNGGLLSADGQATACPGNRNSCAPTYRVCPDTVSSTLCHNISDLVDMSVAGAADGGAADLGGQVVLTPARCLLCCPSAM
jgi:hypothetical protein